MFILLPYENRCCELYIFWTKIQILLVVLEERPLHSCDLYNLKWSACIDLLSVGIVQLMWDSSSIFLGLFICFPKFGQGSAQHLATHWLSFSYSVHFTAEWNEDSDNMNGMFHRGAYSAETALKTHRAEWVSALHSVGMQQAPEFLKQQWKAVPSNRLMKQKGV